LGLTYVILTLAMAAYAEPTLTLDGNHPLLDGKPARFSEVRPLLLEYPPSARAIHASDAWVGIGFGAILLGGGVWVLGEAWPLLGHCNAVGMNEPACLAGRSTTGAVLVLSGVGFAAAFGGGPLVLSVHERHVALRRYVEPRG
jgi:hypothetical protein